MIYSFACLLTCLMCDPTDLVSEFSLQCSATEPTVSSRVTRELRIKLQTDDATDAVHQQLYSTCIVTTSSIRLYT